MVRARGLFLNAAACEGTVPYDGSGRKGKRDKFDQIKKARNNVSHAMAGTAQNRLQHNFGAGASS